MAGPLIRAAQKFLNSIWSARHRPPGSHPVRRSFQAAKSGRLFAGWVGEIGPIDTYLRQDLRALRSNSRRLAMNDDYMKAFLRMVRRNIVGSTGVKLDVRVKDADGSFDVAANKLIEAAWTEWSRHQVCTVCGRYSWLDVQRAVVTAVARDGEVLVREVRGFDNPSRYALQLILADHLDERLNKELPGGREIRMGIERDKWGRPLAYHITTHTSSRRGNRHERVPADQIMHLYVTEDAEQSRGWPWAHTAIRRMGMLGGYEEAALTAARAGASKMGFYQRSADAEPFAEAKDDQGNLVDEAEPGSFEILPAGYEFKEFDPGYPNGEMPAFMKAVLRGAAAGLGVSYTSLANDLEGVNFSSIRAGLLDERDEWMVLQGWLIGTMHSRVFASWLEQTLLSQDVALPFARFDKFNAPFWYPRRWKWVDPDKEGKGNARDVALGVKSRTEIASEQGRDFREVMREQSEEQRIATEMGVTLGDANKVSGNAPQEEANAGNDD